MENIGKEAAEIEWKKNIPENKSRNKAFQMVCALTIIKKVYILLNFSTSLYFSKSRTENKG